MYTYNLHVFKSFLLLFLRHDGIQKEVKYIREHWFRRRIKELFDAKVLKGRVSVQGVKSLGGHFACLCRGFEFFKKKMEILLHFLSFL